MEKKCSKCKIEKNISEFNKNSSRKDKLTCWCKMCMNKYHFIYSHGIGKETRREYVLNNRERRKEYIRSLEGKFSAYKSDAKRRRMKWSLTFEQFSAFWKKNCGYCGGEIKNIGIDRIDNNKGYTLKNAVSCCNWCNIMKNKYTKQEFINQIKKIYLHTL